MSIIRKYYTIIQNQNTNVFGVSQSRHGPRKTDAEVYCRFKMLTQFVVMKKLTYNQPNISVQYNKFILFYIHTT